jgi:hypothetical protein
VQLTVHLQTLHETQLTGVKLRCLRLRNS